MPNDILHYTLMYSCPAALLITFNGENAWLIFLAPRSTHLHGREIALLLYMSCMQRHVDNLTTSVVSFRIFLDKQYKFTKIEIKFDNVIGKEQID